MISEFGSRLDAWVVTAGEELHREVLEVLNAAQESRKNSAKTEEENRREVEEHALKLQKAASRIEDLRAALWVVPGARPPERTSEDAPPVPATAP